MIPWVTAGSRQVSNAYSLIEIEYTASVCGCERYVSPKFGHWGA
jgi:hypothetical protein